MKPVSGENRLDAESATGARLHQLETSQVSRGCWRRANAGPRASGEFLQGREPRDTIKPRVASPRPYCAILPGWCKGYCSRLALAARWPFRVWAAALERQFRLVRFTLAEASARKPMA